MTSHNAAPSPHIPFRMPLIIIRWKDFRQRCPACGADLEGHTEAQVRAEASAARVLELYAGHGNFTCGLAAQAAQLTAVEGEAAAVEACRANLRARERVNARVMVADVRTLPLREHYDVVVLDPPRGGCAELSRLVAQSRAARVVYISCHMTTLSRDLRALQQAGFVVDRAHALDMFPQTGHVEAVVRMRKAASSRED